MSGFIAGLRRMLCSLFGRKGTSPDLDDPDLLLKALQGLLERNESISADVAARIPALIELRKLLERYSSDRSLKGADSDEVDLMVAALDADEEDAIPDDAVLTGIVGEDLPSPGSSYPKCSCAEAWNQVRTDNDGD